MRRVLFPVVLAAGLVVISAPWTAAVAADKSDFALFSASVGAPLSDGAGAVCGSGKINGGKKASQKRAQSFTYYISATNSSSDDSSIKLIFADLNSLLFTVPTGQSFNLSQAGGSNKDNAVVRIVVDDGISGTMSIKGRSQVFCIPCAATEGFDCDPIIDD